MKPTLKLWKDLHSWMGLIFGLLLIMFGVTGIFMLNPDFLSLRSKEVHFAPIEWWYAKVLPQGQGQGGRGQGPREEGENRGGGPNRQQQTAAGGGEGAPREEFQGGRRGGGARGGRGGRGGGRMTVVTLYSEEGKPLQVASASNDLVLQESVETGWQRLAASNFSAGGQEIAVPASLIAAGPGGRGGGGARGGGALTWGRVINDLHRGRFFAGQANWFYTAGAAGFVFLSLTGVWLWLKPFLVRRRSRKNKAALKPVGTKPLAPATAPAAAVQAGKP